MTLFSTSGIRGDAQKLFTPQFCFDLGRSFARFLDLKNISGSIAVGIDTRNSSPHISQSLINGLAYEHRQVDFLGSVPVPAVNYILLASNYAGSIMITGSHIDINSNGLKFFYQKEEISKKDEQEISDIYYHLQGQIAKQAIGTPNPSQKGFDNYLEFLLNLADKPYPKMKMVIDPGNGAQTEIIKAFCRELALDAIFINDNIQDPLLSRDSENDGDFAALQEAVLSNQAQLGVGFDSDGDRVVFVDSSGKFISGDLSGTILSKWHASNQIITPINTSNVVNYIHKEVVRTKVGSPYVIEAIKKNGAEIGFESNGGVIHAEIMFSRDGGSSFVKMLNLLKWSNSRIEDQIALLPHFYQAKTKFSCPIDKYQLVYQQAESFLHHQKIDRTDGIKLELDQNTWVLFRGSGNAPEFRIFVESDSRTKTSQLKDHALEFAKKIANV